MAALGDGDLAAAQAAQRTAEAELAGTTEDDAAELQSLLTAVRDRIGQRAAFGGNGGANQGSGESGGSGSSGSSGSRSGTSAGRRSGGGVSGGGEDEKERAARAARAAAAERAGDGLVFQATARFDEKNYTGALGLINEARDAFQGAGDGGALARAREVGVLGNLYALVLTEAERQQRMQQLLALKRLGDVSESVRQ